VQIVNIVAEQFHCLFLWFFNKLNLVTHVYLLSIC